MSGDTLLAEELVTKVSSVNYQFQISEAVDDPAWDEFLVEAPDGHHVQTSLWAQVKSIQKWKTVRIIVTDNDRIVAGGQLLFRSVAPMINVAYLTKGPVLGETGSPVAEMIIQSAIKISRQRHAQMLVIQPPNYSDQTAAVLLASGFQPSSVNLAPVASAVIDLTQTREQIMAKMKRQTRQNVNRSERDGITIREGGEGDLDTFYQLHAATSQRQQFAPYPLSYFKQMWQIMQPHGYIKLIFAEYEGESVSALLLAPFGNTVIPKILGWSGAHPERRPNDAVFWGAIQWAKDNGYKYFDFEGISRIGALALLNGEPLPESLKHTPDFLKVGFGGQIVLYSIAYDKFFNPLLGWAYHKAAPRVGGHDLFSRIMDWLRKR